MITSEKRLKIQGEEGIRVVFDTNIFLRTLINPKGVNAQIFKQIDKYVLVISQNILEEIIDVVFRTSLRKKYPQIKKISVTNLLKNLKKATIVFPKEKLKVCRDPDDDKFIECALEGKAKYLVTGDKDLKSIGKYKGIEILYAGEFLKIIED